jgi:hypothetical protein
MTAAMARPRLRASAILVVALQAPLLAACPSDPTGPGGQPAPATSTSAKPTAAHGPFFPECGGVSEETIARLTGISGLVTTARNSVGCQWLVGGGIQGPWISFSWFRGSPIGRERASEERMRNTVDDINIDGHSGFVAIAVDSKIGKRLCDVAIQYQDDFFEWSIQYIRKPPHDPCDDVIELSRQSIAAAK